ncbi:MAG: hypothetical protein K9M80_03540 [Candidatus Marinimicrobia bacterium]|nr:hypothetical protein [Candidatus Neomarinimicrobiota bacterium]
MWLPESMTHLLFAAKQEKLNKAIDFIGQKEEFHLIKVEDQSLKQPRTESKITKLKQQKNDIEKIIDYFGFSTDHIEAEAVKPGEVIREADNFIKRFNRELEKRSEKRERLEKEEFQLDVVAELLSLFPDTDFEIQELFEGQYFNMEGGTIPLGDRESLEDVEDVEGFYIFHSAPVKESLPVLIFYSKDEQDRLKRLSNRIRFTKTDKFYDFTGTINECKEEVEIEFWEINEERTQIQSTILDMGEDGRENLMTLNKRIETALRELSWINKMGRTKNVYFINSYIPTSSTRKIKKEIDADDDLYIIEEERIQRDSEKAEGTPIKLKNPGFISPFESLITTYGVPSYKGIDPTVPTMLTFLIMFGIMFADIGHGFVLFILGIGMGLFKFLKNYSYYLTYMGLSAMIFGALFGDFFGSHSFHPLWFSPFENVQQAMLLGLYFGIFMVSTGFLLRIVENLINKDFEELFLSAEGIPGFIFYISLILVLFSTIKAHPGNIIYFEIALTMLAILVIALGRPIKEAITSGLEGETLLESMVEIIHISIAVFSNTLSFIRIAAFNVAHVILTLSIIKIAGMFGGSSTGGKLSMLILGHFMVIVLEGLIVFIQTLRLEYYEFYSRFFITGNLPYKPVKIK